MALIALVIGTATSIAATGRVTLLLLASCTVLCSFVPLVQLFTGLLLVRGARIPRLEALERYFEIHRPWSLWLLASALLILVLPSPGGWMLQILATGLIPLVLTGRALRALGRRELGFSAAIARRRAILHQVMTIAIALAYAEYAGGVVRRFVDVVKP